jgi:hypothetical protein
MKFLIITIFLFVFLIQDSRAAFFQYATNIAPGGGLKVSATQAGDGAWIQNVSASSSTNPSGSVANNASITGTASTFTAPANAVGFILEAESTNSDNIRWAVGTTATSSVGTLAEPGRDTGYVPMGANISVIAISGTQKASVQWILSQ